MRNKKGATVSIGAGFIWAIVLGIIILLFLSTGGGKTISGISKTLSQVPPVLLIIVGLIFILLLFSKKRR